MNYEELINEQFNACVVGIDEEMLSNKESWYDYVISLPTHLRIVYTIVILHQQVFNGGFHQYFFNSYGMFGYLTLDSLKTINASFTLKLLKKVLDRVNDGGWDIETFKDKAFNRKIDKIVNFDNELGNYLDKCDDVYYDAEEDLLLLLGNYLKSIK
ncbi:DUF4375 domain-containing protein [Fulvivirgaceae bacterium BMA12]|uniref:DUF4375 domain-containing protein n=1 Tax=Agaribacillus aureus TaxID=3051825 RepID=A0ABT8L8D6_9BACT|nr:DUF4375 domain-containing protein [Fulvivirgaceae bacterium BMA12]